MVWIWSNVFGPEIDSLINTTEALKRETAVIVRNKEIASITMALMASSIFILMDYEKTIKLRAERKKIQLENKKLELENKKIELEILNINNKKDEI